MSVTPSLLVGLGGIVSTYLLRSSAPSASAHSDDAAHSEKDPLDAEYEPDKFSRSQARRKASLLGILLLLELNSLGRIGFDLVAAERDGGDGRMLGDSLMALFWIINLGIATLSFPLSSLEVERHWDYTVSLTILTSAALISTLLRLVLPSSTPLIHTGQHSGHSLASSIIFTSFTVALEIAAFVIVSTTKRCAQKIRYLDLNDPEVVIPRPTTPTDPSERTSLLETPSKPFAIVSGVADCSPMSYLLFGWISPVLDIGAKVDYISQEDLPLLCSADRAPGLWAQVRMKVRGKRPRWMNSLLWRVIKINQTLFLWQLILACVNAFLYYLPAFFLQRIVLYLEQLPTAPPTPAGQIPYGYVYSLGLLASLAVAALVDGQLWWISNSLLATRIRVQLNSLVFDKTLRRKDVAGSSNTKPTPAKEEEEEERKGSKGIFDVEEGDSSFRNKSQVLTLFTIDVDRVGDFAIWGFSLVDAPLEIIIGTFFLYQILGWAALAGISVAVAFLPVNHWASSQFADVQQKLMSSRDRRTSMMNEVLAAVRMIKFFAFEGSFEERILKARGEELAHLRWNFVLEVAFNFIWTSSPILCILVAFSTYTFVMGETLTPSKAFAALAVFNELRFALNIIPEIIVNGIQCLVSLRRIEGYLELPEVGKDSLLGGGLDGEGLDDKVGFRSATVTWPTVPDDEDSDDEDDSLLGAATPSRRLFELQDLSIDFPPREMSIVCGQIGAGKTLLLLALLGEADLLAGQVYCPRSEPDAIDLPSLDWSTHLTAENWIVYSKLVAYVPQSAWLQSNSIKNNITFGLPFRADRYAATLEACSLVNDLHVFEDGDETEIGEKGVALSGGMKARVSLARAVYSRASLLLLDDILSAVDAHTALHIYEKCLKGPLLAGRTVILVSHHVQLCAPGAKKVVELENGRVLFSGDSKEYLSLDRFKIPEEDDEPIEVKLASKALLKPKNRALSLVAHDSAATSETSGSEAESESDSEDEAEKEDKPAKKMIEEEQRAVGRVKWSVWKTYLGLSGSIYFWATFAAIFGGTKLLEVAETYWLALWAGSQIQESGAPQRSLVFYLSIYALLSFAGVIVSTGQWLVLYLGCWRASNKLHKILLHNILRAPLRFFETNNAGRILNRFGRDLENIDEILPDNIGRTLMLGLGVLTTLAVITSVAPFGLLFFAFLLIFYSRFALKFSHSAREFRRLDSISKSPLYSIYEEAISGVAVIRAFGAKERFMQLFLQRCETNVTFFWYLWGVNRWLSVRFALLSAIVVAGTGAVLVREVKVIDAALAGFALTFALNISNDILFLVRRYTALELTMVAVERIKEYSEIPMEFDNGISPPPTWPHSGAIQIAGLSIRYDPSLPNVLHDLTFSVKGGERIGIVGSTGSGKSTVALSLFRFVDFHTGKILIDGIDITTISLQDLRRRLTIIPQDPTILSGTLRSALDIFGNYSDEAIFDALRRVHLIEAVQPTEEELDAGANLSPFYDLDGEVTEGGNNFSQGQRQLLCLARALLAANKILVLDEATASVDAATDEAISLTIRQAFANSTLLVIAHRLRTIIDFDKVLLLDQGRIVEYDSPSNLLKRIDSRFYALCRATGRHEFKVLRKMAHKKIIVVPKPKKLVRGISGGVLRIPPPPK